jgi:hypothetical protein
VGTDPCFLAEDVGEMAGAGLADIRADLDDGLRCLTQRRVIIPAQGIALGKRPESGRALKRRVKHCGLVRENRPQQDGAVRNFS